MLIIRPTKTKFVHNLDTLHIHITSLCLPFEFCTFKIKITQIVYENGQLQVLFLDYFISKENKCMVFSCLPNDFNHVYI